MTKMHGVNNVKFIKMKLALQCNLCHMTKVNVEQKNTHNSKIRANSQR
jgi:hypothetical protein